MNGVTIWEGLSLIDGEPIVAIMTGLIYPSSNPKTGPMAQTYILRANVHPNEAINNGADVSICGSCELRKQANGVRLCYVNPITLSQVYRVYHLGKYPLFTAEHKALLDFRFRLYGLRIGSYGDPTAVPLATWLPLINHAKEGKGHTGYTARWQLPEVQEYKPYLMASCTTLELANRAREMGWRTYRIGNSPIASIELSCPASEEAGKVTLCSLCLLCGGASRTAPSIVVKPHGSSKTKWSQISSEPIDFPIPFTQLP